jgi:hypothetical protein
MAMKTSSRTTVVETSLAETPVVTKTSTVSDIEVAKSKLEADNYQEVSAQEGGEVVSFHQLLTTVASLGLGVTGIGEAVHRVTGGIVLVEDYEGTLRSYSGGSEDFRGCPDWHHLPDVRHAHVFRVNDWLVAIARPGGKSLGAISLYDPYGESGASAPFALEQAASVLAMELFRLQSVAESELRLWGDMASEILDDPDTNRSRRRANVLGYRIDRPHRAVLIKSVDAKAPQVLAAVNSVARIAGFDATLLTVRPAGVVLLIAEEVDWKEFVRLLSRHIGAPCRLGIGNLHGLVTMRDSLAEAELALSLGKADVVQIEELGVMGFLASDADPVRLRSMVDQWIGGLVAHDAEHGSELVLTLGKFLRNKMGIATTARELYVHSSTLKYRLRRIQELSRHDLRNPDERFNLELACRVFATLEALSAAHPASTEELPRPLFE